MRNLWLVMKTFNVLPTNDDFRNLSDNQLDLILHSIEEDGREEKLARKGLTPDDEQIDVSFEEEVWNKDRDEWQVLKEGHDADEIAKQVEALTKEEDLNNLYSRFEGLDEYNDFLEAGGKTTKETEVEQYINRQITKAEEKAGAIDINKQKGLVDDRSNPDVKRENRLSDEEKTTSLSKNAMEKAISKFNDEEYEDDEYTEL